MMYERLTVNISKAEMDALRAIAQRELRRPRDQARLMLREALESAVGPAPPNTNMKKNDAASVVGPAASPLSSNP